MRRTPYKSRRPGFTIIELAIALGVLAIMAALALPAVDFNRFRMDANARLVQNKLLWAQARAVNRNMQVIVRIDTVRNKFRIIDDSTADGDYTSGEVQRYESLSENMQFRSPPTTVDGSTTASSTGAGLTTVGGYRQLIFYPNGSSSGDVIIYLGSPRGRTEDFRGVKVTSATARVYIYRLGPTGVWSLSEL